MWRRARDEKLKVASSSEKENWGPQSGNWKGLNSANNAVSEEVDSSPLSLRWDHYLANPLIATLKDPEAEDSTKLLPDSWPKETVKE